MSEAVRKNDGHFTYADYASWSEDERWELIDGVAYDMSPSPGQRHQEIAFELSGQVRNQLKGHSCRGYAVPFDVLLSESAAGLDNDITTVVQPDLFIVCDPTKLSERGCRGAPDFVLEILSPGTMVKDLRVKTGLYERFGVKEFWLLNPSDKVVYVFTLNKAGRYDDPVMRAGKTKVKLSSVPGLELDLGEVF